MPEEREVISVGVIYRSPNGHAVERRTHAECETAITDLGLDPAACTVELTEITEEINHWPGVKESPVRERCIWA